jgi:arsenate reductase
VRRNGIKAGAKNGKAENVMNAAPISILFLCTHNSARSVLAEVTANALGHGEVQAYSAGSHPSGRVNSLAIETLQALGYDISSVRSKSWDEFATPAAPHLDIVITVCGDAADEACPTWQGTPVKAHWGLPDPSRARGSEDDRRAAFRAVQQALAERIEALLTVLNKTREPETWRRELSRIHDAAIMPDFAK